MWTRTRTTIVALLLLRIELYTLIETRTRTRNAASTTMKKKHGVFDVLFVTPTLYYSLVVTFCEISTLIDIPVLLFDVHFL